MFTGKKYVQIPFPAIFYVSFKKILTLELVLSSNMKILLKSIFTTIHEIIYTVYLMYTLSKIKTKVTNSSILESIVICEFLRFGQTYSFLGYLDFCP